MQVEEMGPVVSSCFMIIEWPIFTALPLEYSHNTYT